MFKDTDTSEILAFLNSVIQIHKVSQLQNLYNDAVQELKLRSQILGNLYTYYGEFGVKNV